MPSQLEIREYHQALSSLADVHSLFLTYVMAVEDVVTRDDLMDFAREYTEFLNKE